MDHESEQLEAEHSPEAIRARVEEGREESYLRDFVFGAVDGTITTFAVVAGASGADLSSGVIVVMGLANLIADPFSMGVGDFLGLRAESERVLKTKRRISRHIETLSHGPREAVRQVYASKGFHGEELEKVIEVITADPDRWANTLLSEVHGLQPAGPSPIKSGAAIFVAFVAMGTIPLLSFLLDVAVGGPSEPLAWSVALTGYAFFLIGAVKGRVVEGSQLSGGLETLATGGSAAVLACLIGLMLRGLVDSV